MLMDKGVVTYRLVKKAGDKPGTWDYIKCAHVYLCLHRMLSRLFTEVLVVNFQVLDDWSLCFLVTTIFFFNEKQRVIWYTYSYLVFSSYVSTFQIKLVSYVFFKDNFCRKAFDLSALYILISCIIRDNFICVPLLY